ncbi:hypothetical protein [Bradyrhizobium jicamae]|uniref:hypothetical protein n=1 Tax=Bradyrhizobium jicamae TaxID=280332 RepID=UPI001BA65DD6|nr:hypothetical protein [Bradyrhizobium jicamae]MBR0939432.1 hypothetical protein [Bradyrhizobium jicamae]
MAANGVGLFHCYFVAMSIHTIHVMTASSLLAALAVKPLRFAGMRVIRPFNCGLSSITL